MRPRLLHVLIFGLWAGLYSLEGLSGEEGGKAPGLAKPEVELCIFDVRDLTAAKVDFPGPTPHSENYSAPQSPFQQAPAAPTLSPSDLASLLKDKYLANDFTDPSTSIEESGGKLVVMQTKLVHKKIAAFLEELRAQVMQQVCIQGLEIALEPEHVLDWLGKAGQEIPSATVEKLLKEGSGAALVSAPQFTTYQGVRSHVVAGRKVTYLADVDVSGGMYDPVIRSFVDGAVLDARPTLDHTGRRVSLDLSFFRSTPQGEVASMVFEGLLADRATLKSRGTSKSQESKDGAKVEGKPGKQEMDAVKGGEVVEETTQRGAPQILGKVHAQLELPKLALRSVRTNFEFPVKTWILAAILSPLPRVAPGSQEAKPLLLFVRCDPVLSIPASEKGQGQINP